MAAGQLPDLVVQYKESSPEQAWLPQAFDCVAIFLAAASTAAVVSSSLHRYFLRATWKSSWLMTGPVPSHLAFFCRSAQSPSRSKSPL
jgi:hypothetical protein